MSSIIKEIQKYKFAKDAAVLKALKTVESGNMIEKGDRILISISGGPDSTFLTRLFYLLRPALKLEIFGFCLDHMTRGGESEKDSLFVRKMCGELDIKLFERKVDVKKWCRSKNLSFQKGARLVRISKLLDISEKNNIDKIATGHNADDSIETFFMNLFRGAGARGLSGIKPAAGRFIRPLIEISGEEIKSYLDKKKIAYCMDRTNVQNIYYRNRIRNILIPFISRNFGDSFKSNTLRALHILKDEDDFLSEYSLSRFKNIASMVEEAKEKRPVLVELPIKRIMKEEVPIKRRIILLAMEAVKGNLEDISFQNVEDILKMCTPGGESKVVRPEENIRVCKTADRIFFIDITKGRLIPDEFKELLKGDVKAGRYLSRKKEVRIGESMKLEDFGLELSTGVLKYDRDKISVRDAGKMEAYMDYSKVKPPIKVRAWKEGDKFYPLGMDGEKKLQDFFIDNKAPLHLRKTIPVFEDNEKIIWVGSYRIDERVKVTANTGKVLHLKLF
ncbi:MAG: tRNA lysidine(34) synthetase TilS [Actinomycetota bacterium]|nr:tRNA lysidine(34) synthetase TilS [Actinomycetota bacterium]